MSDTKFALIFPGQGSQKEGMLAALAGQTDIVTETFAEASEALGYDLWALASNGPQEEMNLTEKTQPLLLTSSVAIWRVLSSRGLPKPQFMAGHSLGEFSALVCSGVLDFAETVKLVQMRGQFMQTAVPVGVGAMAAIIGLDDDVIVGICENCSSDETVQAVNFNSPGQVVIAGHAGAVEKASEACKEAGAKRALPLPVSAPFHTSLMKPAGDELAKVMDSISFSQPEVPVVHNVHAQTESNPDKIRTLMVEQIFSPVRWGACMQTMLDTGVNAVLECGPGKVLCGLSRRIDRSVAAYGLEEPEEIDKALEAIK